MTRFLQPFSEANKNSLEEIFMKLYAVTLMSVFAASFLVGFAFLDEANGLGLWIPIAISACILSAMLSLGAQIVSAQLESQDPDFWAAFMQRKHRRHFRKLHAVRHLHGHSGKAAA